MSAFEKFRRRVEDFIASLEGEGTLSGLEVREIQHLVDHNEIGEALRTLAWIVVEEDKRISRETLELILEFSSGLVDEEQMPPGLASHVEERSQE